VHEEFAMYDVSMRERAQRVTDTVTTLRAAFTGEPFEYRGRIVRVTPAPFSASGPNLLLGGSSEPAARRATRTGQYDVLTPDQLVAELKAAPFPFINLHPLCGGIPPEVAWSSLRLLEHEVIPAFR
jgi:alkanesulfonate monooxygenase SsuD/methylene tetrahydromethanopterin reductase-like flavin-dependent oxidoreductase (luciferase family)